MSDKDEIQRIGNRHAGYFREQPSEDSFRAPIAYSVLLVAICGNHGGLAPV
jgi:hypothetical protein